VDIVIFVQVIIMGTVRECMEIPMVECMALRMVELEGIVVGCMGTVHIEEVTGGCIMEACTVAVLVVVLVAVLVAQWVVMEWAWVLAVIKIQIIPLVLHRHLQAFGFLFFKL
jgi:hypothetical protein